jgi:hypothetical protein
MMTPPLSISAKPTLSRNPLLPLLSDIEIPLFRNRYASAEIPSGTLYFITLVFYAAVLLSTKAAVSGCPAMDAACQEEAASPGFFPDAMRQTHISRPKVKHYFGLRPLAELRLPVVVLPSVQRLFV